MQLVLMKQHHAHLDILKGIAIAMVAMGHVFLDMPRNPAFHVICSVHMPIFMLVSGYLSARPLPTSSKEVLSYWSKKVIQLLLPLLSLPLIYCIIFAKPLDELVFGDYFFVFSTPSLIGRLNIVEYGRSFGIELFVVLITVAIIMSLTLATIAIVRSNSLLAMLFYGERASR